MRTRYPFSVTNNTPTQLSRIAIGSILAITLAGCQSLTTQPNGPVADSKKINETYPALPPATDMIRLKEGQTLKPTGLPISVTFDKVLSDSRCPSNAKCIWAGNATVALTIANNQGKAQTVNLSTGDLRGELKRKTTLYGHTISLETVYPTPTVNTDIKDLIGKYLIDVKVVPAS